MEAFAAMCLNHDTERESFAESCKEHVKMIFPAPVDYETWKPVIGAIRADIGAYAAICFRKAYKALYENLPSAGTGTGSGGKGMNAKRAATGLQSRIDAVVEYMAKIPKKSINAKVMAQLADAVEALTDAGDAFSKAVNE